MPKRMLPLIAVVSLLAAAAATAETLTHAWSRSYGDISWQDASDVAVDADGNIFLLGSNWGTIEYGGDLLTSAGSADVVVAKLDPDGHHIWSRQFGDGSNDAPVARAVDPGGDVVIGGQFQGGIDFGGGVLTSAGDTDLFIAKLDGATGAHLWSRSFGDAGAQGMTDVDVDAQGGVHICGYFQGSLNFGGLSHSCAGGYDIFVARFTAGGGFVWSRSFGDATNQYANGIAAHPAGLTLITGFFEGAVNFGGGLMVSQGGSDFYLAAYDDAGGHVWSMVSGDANTDVGRRVVVDGGGFIVVAGYYSGTIFGGGGLLTSTGALDGFLAKFDSVGSMMSSWNVGGAGSQMVNGLAVDAEGFVLATGEFYTEVDLGGGAVPGAGSSDIFLGKYDPSGGYVWGAVFGGGWYQYPGQLATDGSRSVIMFAGSEEPVDLGGGALPYGGATDQVLAKYGLDPDPLIAAINDVGNDQGRFVRIDFAASILDAFGSLTPILQYEAFRQIGGEPAKVAGEPGAPMLSSPAVLAEGWEYVGAVPAHCEPFYSMIAPTLADSTAEQGIQWSTFFIRAATASPGVFFDSEPVPGYSVDNLAPNVPEGLMVAYAAGGNALEWLESEDADFRYFKIYRGDDPDFPVDPDAPVQQTTAAAWVDEGGGFDVFYKVSAVDFAGNESPASAPLSLTGVGPATPARVALLQNAPNPFNPATVIRYYMPAAGEARLTLHALDGRRVAVLAEGPRPRGWGEARWDGRDAAGRPVASGSYVACLEAGGVRRTVRMTLVR